MSAITRRQFTQMSGMAVLASAVSSEAGVQPASGLASPAFRPLLLGEIHPEGWLRRQLRLQADGLSGHLDEFWPDVGSTSGWLGGAGESWERGPYFVDGLLPLAWQLQDETLKSKATPFIEWTLTHQQPSGMLGPTSNDDWWPRMVMVKVLAQYFDATSDPRVPAVLTRYFQYQLATLTTRPLRDWGKYRWQDEVLIVEWLYDRTGDSFLLSLAALLKKQGFDWTAGFQHFVHLGVTTRASLDEAATGGNKPDGMETHGVNNGQALKTAAVQYRLSGNRTAELANFRRQLGCLDQFHGLPNGMFSCDEHLAGLDPSHGTELCTVVETLFSLETALATFGEATIGDRIEKVAFNALPGTFTDDMWAHQYNQQSNQILVGLNSKPWTTDGPESNLYGLEPNFGCCTANFHQGWPKLTQHLWMRSADGGLVAALYAPCSVSTRVGSSRVSLRVTTDYPFRETIRIRVDPERATRFPLRLRIPAWANSASLQVNGRTVPNPVVPGTFALVERTWRAGDAVDLMLPMRPSASRWFHGSVALSRGPLVFSYEPGARWVKLRNRGRTADWQVYPERSWNYAMDVDELTAGQIEVQQMEVGARPFAAETTAVMLRVPARRLDSWRSEDGVAQPVPAGLQRSSAPLETLEMIPYGAARLRVTAFPQLDPACRQHCTRPEVS